MSFRLPSETHPSCAYFDMASLAEMLAPANVARLPTFSQARAAGRKQAGVGNVQAVTYVCMRSNDDRVLVKVGPRGGWKQLWNFGNGRN